ncbi:MAG: RNA pyrophosphohydrolase [Sulfuricurvum sp. GWF2_44_89]|uniref:RNA pyrophosphohydrolase n=1 Tax=Sulfuricurvum kujiense TaxID=148813 RepID=A0A2D3WGF7_9BACT|nr:MULTISPECIES: RNA pyrophosphohydrolase [Sulfuricurvum]OHD77801.1 MAG: RNA pyrophosphohydrolase [Sulfuricurvum sp. GWF2_44_89]OHD91438.1 MAG: RNA pyrophosphohydrolase [Sulfuricurvum sp. RIFOXYD2_FULL_44_160]OHD96109.1 MAG: RNA pyrophosphohydrolase [Sulfuricurvum sp. RIFOXYD12_FULL_44_77]DAB38160.1 MAG TPA: RNA pyrophosphohydrolase [Sulfuricurvum kujiense]
MTEKKFYRPNVAAIIVSHEYPEIKDIFIAERSDLDGVWQFPQGGIDEGESSEEALFRELGEEIGTKKVEIIAEYPDWIAYDFPSHVAAKMAPYAGQKQRYYLVRLKKGAVINLETKHPEFKAYRFVNSDELLTHVAHFKKPVYERVISHFRTKGYL